MAANAPAWRRVLNRFGGKPFTREQASAVATPDEIQKLIDIGMLVAEGDSLQVLDPAEWESFDQELQGG